VRASRSQSEAKPMPGAGGSEHDRDEMKRNRKRGEVGREAPIVISPRDLVRLLEQVVNAFRRHR